MSALRVLGIDPGLRVCGWGVIDVVEEQLVYVDSGTLRPDPDAPILARLSVLQFGIRAVLDRLQPAAVAIEEAFAGRNVRSALRLGEARAACMLAAAGDGLPVHEIPPALVKKAVAGHGRASKDGVRDAVLRALVVPEALSYDAADALALALCALRRLESPLPSTGARPMGRRRRGRKWTARDVAGFLED
ncbi:MAG: crossover junction endodeoxyribonuclease RuvC [Planctomycetes bacterium]|nr:crossover junction endodeoxyribonuclease RuvC [Planctomycetota bacterium]